MAQKTTRPCKKLHEQNHSKVALQVKLKIGVQIETNAEAVPRVNQQRLQPGAHAFFMVLN